MAVPGGPARPLEPAADVIVPVLNGGARFRECLSALSRQQAPFHLIVVDNGSSDGSAQAARAAGATVVYEPRRSSYAARNRALAETRTDIFAFLDSDCLPDPSWLNSGLSALDTNGWDLCAGEISQTPGRSAASRYDAFFYARQHEHVRAGYGATGNLFVRRRVFQAVGQFSVLRSGGDRDFGLRATAAGFRIGYARSAVVDHPPVHTLREVLKKGWRISIGHGRLIARGHWPLRKDLHWRRLKPPYKVLHTRDIGVIAVDMAWRATAYLARLVGFAAESLTQRLAARRSPREAAGDGRD